MEYYMPFTYVTDTDDTIPAKKNALDGYTEFDTSFFETDDAKLIPSEQELAVAEEVKKTEKKASVGRKKKEESVVVQQMQIQGSESVPYARSYDETNAMLRQAIIQADVMTSEIKSDLDKIRGSSTMKSKYTYITNLIHSSVDPKTVQYLAGHESSKITLDIYAKVKYNRPDELAGILRGAFAQWDAAQ